MTRSSSPGRSASWSPRQLGYRLPAEWEPHQATWVSWPHNRETWPGCFEQAVREFAHLVAMIAQVELVRINVNDIEMERAAQRAIENIGGTGCQICFHHFPTNDAWCRDHAAIFLQRMIDNLAAPPLLALDWGFNSWGGKYPPFDLDNAIPQQMARALQVPSISGGMILEGGSLDANGAGLMMTTSSCLLNSNRNPEWSRRQIEIHLSTMLGMDHFLWLAAGIAGDDTDGHIDNLARFTGTRTVVAVVETNERDENYRPLQDNLRQLRNWKDATGERLRVITIPMPAAAFHQGQRLPASYANFYIANGRVLVPQFNQPSDGVVRLILEECFPDREVMGIDCTSLVTGLGAIHCLTQQVPAGIATASPPAV